MKLSGNDELIRVIKNKIKKEGAISFKEFMEIALYYPEYGYYTSNKDKIGGFGDYFTASELDPIFGQLLAKQFMEVYREYFSGENFHIVEIGSGKGYLLQDVIRSIKENWSDIFDRITFISVERSPYHRKLQQELLQNFNNLLYLEDVSELPKIRGVIYSNELFDAIPTHMVRVRNGKVYEVYITLKDDEDVVEEEKVPSENILSYLKRLGIRLPDGMTTEINLDAVKLLKEIGLKLEKGFMFTIDYGYPSAELYKPYRNRGTLVCYHRHRYNENYYENVGIQDITSHVNFSALSLYGEEVGLKTLAFTDQAHFLINLGMADELSSLYKKRDYRSYERVNRLKTLVLPKGMGEKFKVLVQFKGIENPRIEGLKVLPPQTDRYKL